MAKGARRRGPMLALVALAVVVLLTATVSVIRVRLANADVECAQADDARSGRWCRLYDEDFSRPAERGSFVNTPANDWHLQPDHPYAGSLRSYPDGWGTTADWSLNYASKTTDVVAEALGAQGVLRLHGHSQIVDGRPRSLGGSFYPVINRSATDAQQQMAQTYGRYTVRFATTGGYRPNRAGKYPVGSQQPSYGTAFLLWPANDRWAEGEVDFPESAWGAPLSGSVHRIGRPEINADTFELPITSEKRWITATIEWTPGLLVFLLDGVEVRRVTRSVPSTPFRWGFQSGGTFGTPAADLAGYLYVDSISIDDYVSDWRLR